MTETQWDIYSGAHFVSALGFLFSLEMDTASFTSSEKVYMYIYLSFLFINIYSHSLCRAAAL